MSTLARSCLQCRTAKVKCDLVRPSCGRCKRRGTPCDGYHTEGSITFRDETRRAQRLSRRARGETQDGASPPIPKPEPQELEASAPASEDLVVNAIALKSHLSWLNEQALAALPARVRLDPETHAVDRFFANWIVYPNDVSPGYMHHLPLLYEKALPNSVLHLSVRALAFADVRRTSSGGREYEVKGLQSYGAAITKLRIIAREPKNFQDDEILAALLLIDAFETMYMGRNEPLGLHDQALKYMLQVRGVEQLHSSRRFCLSRIAIYRLQARQLLLGEDSGTLQQNLLDSLNQERPDLRVMYHVSQIINLCARADHLVHYWWQEPRENATNRLTDLLQEIGELNSSIEAWTSTLDDGLKPLTVMADLTNRLSRTTTSSSSSSDEDHTNPFKCPSFLKHHDISVAFLWSFYAAAQIILRDNTIQILRLAASLAPDNAQQYLDRTRWEELAIDGLSSAIIRSFPKFMGFDVGTPAEFYPEKQPSQASSLGRFLGAFSMVVVKKTEATSETHKSCAEKVLAWMHKSSLTE